MPEWFGASHLPRYGGSGKSYVARELGRLLGLPVTHMDAVYFDDQWNSLPMERFEAAQRELVAAAYSKDDARCCEFCF